MSDEEVTKAPFYRPPEDSPEIKYLKAKREELGGYVPTRRSVSTPLKPPPNALFEEFLQGTDGREVSTTMVFVRILNKLLRDEALGKLIVPIVPDEARTFGMEALFRQVGIYSHSGQLYEPVDRDSLLYYKEAQDGQILEEGITEAGSMASFIAAGTAYSTHGVNTIPFYIYYSMFGFQRIGDLIWAAADMCARGFLIGGTAGRTTLNGEGLQHQDGNSHHLAYPVPNLLTYDPAFAFEMATIIQDGIRRMYHEQEKNLLLPHRLQRELRHARDARGSERRDTERHVPLQAVRGEFRAQSAAIGQRHHHERGAQGAENAGGELFDFRGCMERHEL